MSITLQELIIWQTVQTHPTSVSDTLDGAESRAETQSDGFEGQMVKVKTTSDTLPEHLNLLFNNVFPPLLSNTDRYDNNSWWSSGAK